MRTKSTTMLPISPVQMYGNTLSLDVRNAKQMILFTGNNDLLSVNNEFLLNTNRLTLAESPFGGLKGSQSPNYTVGTVTINSGDGIYLTDTDGNNSSKTLSAGKLKEVSSLTVDTTAKTVTETFRVVNTNTSNDSLPLEDFSNPALWSFAVGSGTISIENGKLKIVGKTDGNGQLFIKRTVAFDLSTKYFYKFQMNSTLAGKAYGSIGSDVNNRVSWSIAKTTTSINANTDYSFVLPFRASASSTGTVPSDVIGSPVWSNITMIRVGIVSAVINTDITLYFGNIAADTGKWATVEIDVPDNVVNNPISSLGADVSGKKWELWTYKSSTYNKALYYLANAYGAGAGAKVRDLYNIFFADGTAIGEIYRYNDSYNAWGIIPYQPGTKLESKTKETLAHTGMTYPTTITYLNNAGCKNRIGFAICLPPSDSERTGINKLQVQIICYYENSGATTYEFENSTNATYGLQNVLKPYILFYDVTKSGVDYYIFSKKPTGLAYRKDDTGNIYQVDFTLSNNTRVYKGHSRLCNFISDGDSNLIPNFIDKLVTTIDRYKFV